MNLGTGSALLHQLQRGWLDAAGLLADWLEEQGDVRGIRLRREWQRSWKARCPWLIALFDPRTKRMRKITPAQRRRAVAVSLFDYAIRLLSVPADAPLPRQGLALPAVERSA